METLKPAIILMRFFGKLPGQTTTDFAKELKALSDAEKIELATLAAKELGVAVDSA